MVELIDYDWLWLTMVENGYLWLTMVDYGWPWLITIHYGFLCHIMMLIKSCRITMLLEFLGTLWQKCDSWCLTMVDMVDFVSYCYVSRYVLWRFDINYVLYHYGVIWRFCCITIKKNHAWLWYIMFDNGWTW